jgi:4-oxalocrotonate tautomerase
MRSDSNTGDENRFAERAAMARMLGLSVETEFEEGNVPYVQITWVEGRSVEQKRVIAERFTTVLIEDGKAKRENIHVVFHDLPATNYAEAGTLVIDQKRTP